MGMIKFILGIVVGAVWGVLAVLIVWEEVRRRHNNKTKNKEL